MSKSTLVLLFTITSLVTTFPAQARNWYDGYKITKVYDQRPHRQQLDIYVTPSHFECSIINFPVGGNGQTDEHLDRVLSVALAALLADKIVGGFWDDPNSGCDGTNLYITKNN